MQNIPRTPGIYVLILELSKPYHGFAGKLRVDLEPGTYMYVGSARGPGGLAARIRRHLRREKNLHWHIDYLLQEAEVKVVVYAETGDPQGEEKLAAQLKKRAVPVARGFGCTDKRNDETHLFKACSVEEAVVIACEAVRELNLEPKCLVVGEDRISAYN